jgi:hypothetical protein
MEGTLFRYRSRELSAEDLCAVRELIGKHGARGRSHISRVLCEAWGWRQPNGAFKQYAARDLLLRLEERGLVSLPPRLKPKNNLAVRDFAQIPIFVREPLSGTLQEHGEPSLHLVRPEERYLWKYLLHHSHYLGVPRLVGEHLSYLAVIGGQVVACLAWASAAWKVGDRDRFIGWDEQRKRRNLHLIANNSRFLIPDWVSVPHLASKVLSLSLRRLSRDWQAAYGHPVYLAETFVDLGRFAGTCYRAANWQRVGQTRGSAKRGNRYRYHGQPKAIYLYPLHRQFRRYLLDAQG